MEKLEMFAFSPFPFPLRKRYSRGGVCVITLLILYAFTRTDETQNPQVLSKDTSYRYPHRFKYLSNPGRDICGKVESVNILILVASALTHNLNRNAIRQTWGSSNNLHQYNAKVLFLVGREAVPSAEVQADINEEYKQYRDILQEDFIDSYSNLTIKTIAGIKWSVENCPQAKYVMKTDDDIYVNLDELSQFLESRKAETKSIYGCIKNGPQGAPQPISVNGRKFGSVHPPFTAGAGYVISTDIIPTLANISQNIRIIRVEDAFLTGYCAARIEDVNKVHVPTFSCGQIVDRNCDMKRRVTGHKITPSRMLQIHHDLKHSC